MSRKRKILSLAAGLALVATVASAFFLAEAIFSGEGTDTGGSQEAKTYPLTVTFSGVPLLPGVHKSVKLAINNESGHALFAHKLVDTITTGNEAACPKTWFVLVPQHEVDQLLLEGKADQAGSEHVYEIPTGETNEWAPGGGEVELLEKEEPTNQAGCAGVPIHVKVQVITNAT
jgi:hypothetical protein